MSSNPFKYSAGAVKRIDLSRLDEDTAKYNWITKPWLGRDAMTLLIGEGGSCKSLLALDLAIAIAAGRRWLGHEVEKGGVLYLDEDGQEGETKRRLKALCAARGLDPASLQGSLYVNAPSGLQIESGDTFADVKDAALSVNATLIVVDALVAMHSRDENSSNQMKAVMRSGLRPLMRHTGAGMLIVHHAGKPSDDNRGTNRARGSTEIINSTDAALFLSQRKTGPRLEMIRSRVLARTLWPATLKIEVAGTEKISILAKVSTTVDTVTNLIESKGLLSANLTQRQILDSLHEWGCQCSLGTVNKAMKVLGKIPDDQDG